MTYIRPSKNRHIAVNYATFLPRIITNSSDTTVKERLRSSLNKLVGFLRYRMLTKEYLKPP
jgi:hypothetical protein